MNYIQSNLKIYLLGHLRAMLFSLGQLWSHLPNSAINILIIGIALSLPAGLYILIQNIKQVSIQWDYVNQISLFMEQNLSDQQIKKLTEKLKLWPEIAKIKYQTSNKSLENFEKLLGLNNILSNLTVNPLPDTIIINIKNDSLNPNIINNLLVRLESFIEIEQTQFDMEWLQYIRSINKTGSIAINILVTLLSLSLLLIISNTIHMSIINQQSDIRVIKIIGGTNNFINRPFLYAGFWFGLIGGIISWFILLITLVLLSKPINELILLYNSQFTLRLFLRPMLIVLPMSGIILGILGSWIAVKINLKII